MRRVAIFTGLVCLFLDLEVGWFDGVVAWLGAVALAGLFWALREHVTLILFAVFATVLATSLLRVPGDAYVDHRIETGARPAAPPSVPSAAPARVLHLVLDAFAGPNGIPDDLPGGPQLEAEVVDFFARNGFRLHPDAIAEYAASRASISGILNFVAGSAPEGRYHGKRWRLTAYDSIDGRPAWDARLGRRQTPVLPAGPIPDAQLTGTRRVYALVEPPRGVIGEFVVERDERLWPDPTGGFVLIGRELRELDPDGRLARQRLFDGVHAHTVTSTHVLVQDGDTIEIYDREQLRERARLEGRLNISDDDLPDDRLLLWRGGEDGVALILGLEAPSRGSDRRQDDAG